MDMDRPCLGWLTSYTAARRLPARWAVRKLGKNADDREVAMLRTTIFGALAVALVLAGLPGRAGAQSYPAKTVTIVVPAAAGGGIDLSARWIAAELTTALGKTVVVENKGGASGITGTQQVARAEPDGHTLLVTLSGFLVTSPALFNSLPWDPVKDFAPVSMLWTSPHVLVVNKDSPINSLSELIASGRANPGKLTYGSPGLTSETHIGSEMFGQMANVKLRPASRGSRSTPGTGSTPQLGRPATSWNGSRSRSRRYANGRISESGSTRA